MWQLVTIGDIGFFVGGIATVIFWQQIRKWLSKQASDAEAAVKNEVNKLQGKS
jgi:hypothetical protein